MTHAGRVKAKMFSAFNDYARAPRVPLSLLIFHLVQEALFCCFERKHKACYNMLHLYSKGVAFSIFSIVFMEVGLCWLHCLS